MELAMRPHIKFAVRQATTGWTYDLWSLRTGWLCQCGDNASEDEANYNAPRAADRLAFDLLD